jgi:ubiquitin carboxyl-terminal hydrolase 4/11/15
LVIELYNHKIDKVYPQYEPVANIGAFNTIYVYQLPGPIPPLPKKKASYSCNRLSDDDNDEEKQPIDENQLIVFPVYCATVTKNENTYSSNNERISQFGDPIILAVPRKDINKPELLYHLVSQHVERYTQFKLFEEVKENGTNPFLTEEETSVVEEQPPGYESVMAEEDGRTNQITEVEPLSTNDDDDDNMELDFAQPSNNNLIHTAAAVTPAGGKKIEPMSNLFAMKVFSDPRSYNEEPGELLPIIQSWYGLVDLCERAEAEQKQREEYMRQQDETESDTEMEDSLVLPNSNTIDEDDDDQVEDAAALFGNSTPSNAIDTPEEEQVNEDETEADDHDSMDNASFHSDNNSDRFMSGKPLPPLIASVSLVTAPAPSLPKRRVTCPPSTIIRQGEGILLQWTPKKAQQLFGSARLHSNNSGVCTDAWNDMHDLGDPNIELNQASQTKQVTLSDCLDEFTKEEELSEEDLWYCPKCKKHQRATKKFDLWRMPEIMVVHLKRFSHSRTWRDKIDELIDFPTSELDLTDRVLSIEDHTKVKDEDRLIYDLYGVDNHFGGLGGGHCKYQ